MGQAAILTSAPLIVTAGFSAADFSWLERLRRRYYPAERNHAPAHLTLFHHLPPSELQFLKERLRDETRNIPAPRARLASVRCAGSAVWLAVESPALADIRERLADAMTLVLVPQDRAFWHPHVTVQNKVSPGAAKGTADELRQEFRPRPLAISALLLWQYTGGPWTAVGRYPFQTT